MASSRANLSGARSFLWRLRVLSQTSRATGQCAVFPANLTLEWREHVRQKRLPVRTSSDWHGWKRRKWAARSPRIPRLRWTGLELRRSHLLSLVSGFIESGPTFVESIQAGPTNHERRICPRTGFDPLADLRHPEFHRTEQPAKRTLFPGSPPSGQKPG